MKKYFNHFPDITEDPNAKSLSYNFSGKCSFINKEIISELERIGKDAHLNARISLHASGDNALHNMIIMQRKGTYNCPHKHLDKAEAYHLILGEQMVFIFDESGTVVDQCRMSKDENMIYRFEKNMFHMSVPLSEVVIFHESKIGPFIREGDSLFAPWAPQADDHDAVDSFLESFGVK